ncbi:uncharacterized protein LOC108627922 [Ceratina calcarata]|uniref:Uncharacterized protein LOC108627922 n=1 Tax=Ceratina calcarata TaxID=156304 RepID=A0AAJ7J502_9HYME|nr:uncharacterized protein LOC108627922 [Ceratina calcarata]XP_026671510.1 uncharacterized protein LOC108627922 [Ceratina calcarata]
MIDQWQSIMDNLSDIYYLVRLIIRQVSIYLRDLILYKFFWMAANADEFEAAETKLRGLTFRNMITDIVAFSVICVVLFLLVLLSSKCEKEDGQLYTATGIETVSVNLPEDPFRVSDTSSTTLDCFHACGDSAYPRRPRIPKRNYSDEDVVRVRSNSEKRKTRIQKKSIFALTAAILPQNSQSTQTTDKLFVRTSQRWLIRRTRSGHVYGKYPI